MATKSFLFTVPGDPVHLRTGAAAYRALAADFTTYAAKIRDIPLRGPDWEGDAADAAEVKRGLLVGNAEQFAAACVGIAGELEGAAKKIEDAKVEIIRMGVSSGLLALVAIALTVVTAGVSDEIAVLVEEGEAVTVAEIVASVGRNLAGVLGNCSRYGGAALKSFLIVGGGEAIGKGVYHWYTGTPWSANDISGILNAASIGTVAGGISGGIGRSVGLRYGGGALAKVLRGAAFGSGAGATAGVLIPIANAKTQGDPVNWKAVGYSTLIGFGLGGIFGGAGAKAAPPGAGNAAHTEEFRTALRALRGSGATAPVASADTLSTELVAQGASRLSAADLEAAETAAVDRQFAAADILVDPASPRALTDAVGRLARADATMDAATAGGSTTASMVPVAGGRAAVIVNSSAAEFTAGELESMGSGELRRLASQTSSLEAASVASRASSDSLSFYSAAESLRGEIQDLSRQASAAGDIGVASSLNELDTSLYESATSSLSGFEAADDAVGDLVGEAAAAAAGGPAPSSSPDLAALQRARVGLWDAGLGIAEDAAGAAGAAGARGVDQALAARVRDVVAAAGDLAPEARPVAQAVEEVRNQAVNAVHGDAAVAGTTRMEQVTTALKANAFGVLSGLVPAPGAGAAFGQILLPAAPKPITLPGTLPDFPAGGVPEVPTA